MHANNSETVYSVVVGTVHSGLAVTVPLRYRNSQARGHELLHILWLIKIWESRGGVFYCWLVSRSVSMSPLKVIAATRNVSVHTCTGRAQRTLMRWHFYFVFSYNKSHDKILPFSVNVDRSQIHVLLNNVKYWQNWVTVRSTKLPLLENAVIVQASVPHLHYSIIVVTFAKRVNGLNSFFVLWWLPKRWKH